MNLPIAVIQMTSGRDRAANLAFAEQEIRASHQAGALLVSLPETLALMESDRDRLLTLVQLEADDTSLAFFRNLARELGIILHLGSLIIRLPSGKLANRAFVIGREGQIIGRYDKLHLFDVRLSDQEIYRESALYQPGQHALLARIKPFAESKDQLVHLGVTICYDLRFPLLYRRLAQAGADIIVVPSAFTEKTGQAHWHSLLRARAIETGCFMVAAAQGGLHENGRRTYGHSLVVSPWGEILLDAGLQEGHHRVDLDLNRVKQARALIPSLEDRPDYGLDDCE